MRNGVNSGHLMPVRPMASASTWGPRTGMLLDRPAHRDVVHRSTEVKNEHINLPPDIRQYLVVVDEAPDRVNMAYFRRSNIERINQLIIETVAKRTNGAYRIGRQSESAVRQLVIDVYVRHAHAIPGTALEIVEKLNGIVAHMAAGNIIPNVSQYLTMLRDMDSSAPTGPPLPLTGRSTDKTATFKAFI